jgi:hypothetical protein
MLSNMNHSPLSFVAHSCLKVRPWLCSSLHSLANYLAVGHGSHCWRSKECCRFRAVADSDSSFGVYCVYYHAIWALRHHCTSKIPGTPPRSDTPFTRVYGSDFGCPGQTFNQTCNKGGKNWSPVYNPRVPTSIRDLSGMGSRKFTPQFQACLIYNGGHIIMDPTASAS